MEQSLHEQYAGKSYDFLQIDDKAKHYLRNSLGIEFIGTPGSRPSSSSMIRMEPTTRSVMQFRTRTQINAQKDY